MKHCLCSGRQLTGSALHVRAWRPRLPGTVQALTTILVKNVAAVVLHPVYSCLALPASTDEAAEVRGPGSKGSPSAPPDHMPMCTRLRLSPPIGI